MTLCHNMRMILLSFSVAPHGLFRVPDGQETVKKQALGAEFLEKSCALIGQPDEAAAAPASACEKRRPAAFRFPFDDLQVDVHALRGKPADGLRLAAEFVDELVRQRLAAGEDRPVGKRRDLGSCSADGGRRRCR